MTRRAFPPEPGTGVPEPPRQLQPAQRNRQPSYARAPPLRATPAPPRRPRPGAQQREVQGEAGRVPGETGARRARSPAPQASRTAPLGASMRPPAAREPLPRSASPAGPRPLAAGTCAGGTVGRASEVKVTAGVLLGSGHLSCLGASPFRPPPGLRRSSLRRLWPCPLWMPDSGFSASFRKGRFFSTPPRRESLGASSRLISSPALESSLRTHPTPRHPSGRLQGAHLACVSPSPASTHK